MILAGWVNQQQQQIIDFQRAEIDVLKEKLGKKRTLLNDDQRRRLVQIARNLTDTEDGFLKGKRYVLMDRDGKFCPAFQAILKTEGVKACFCLRRAPI